MEVSTALYGNTSRVGNGYCPKGKVIADHWGAVGGAIAATASGQRQG